jgi:hypothetical protein
MRIKNKLLWLILGIASAVTAVFPLIIGFNKLLAYDNGEYYPYVPVNAYVGGDAYNFIINANYASAYFILAGTLILSAIGCGILWYLSGISTETINKEPVTTLPNPNELNSPDSPESSDDADTSAT